MKNNIAIRNFFEQGIIPNSKEFSISFPDNIIIQTSEGVFDLNQTNVPRYATFIFSEKEIRVNLMAVKPLRTVFTIIIQNPEEFENDKDKFIIYVNNGLAHCPSFRYQGHLFD